MESKMIFNFIFGRKRHRTPTSSALSDLRVGDRAIVRELELDHPTAEHLMNLGFVPGLEVMLSAVVPAAIPGCIGSKGLRWRFAASSRGTSTCLWSAHRRSVISSTEARR